LLPDVIELTSLMAFSARSTKAVKYEPGSTFTLMPRSELGFTATSTLVGAPSSACTGGISGILGRSSVGSGIEDLAPLGADRGKGPSFQLPHRKTMLAALSSDFLSG
jgi:hypothetical protein